MDIEIIQATPDHIDLITPLFCAYREFYERDPLPEASRAYLQARLENQESVIFLALAPDGRAAFGFTQLYPTFASLDLAPSFVLYDLYVAPAARRQGIARALMSRAHQYAAAAGATTVMLDTAVDNQAAQKLYEEMGYERETEFYTYYLTLNA